MNVILINSNNESSFVASSFNGKTHVRYTSDYLDPGEKNAFLRSPDKLVHCLKHVTEKIESEGNNFSEIDAISVITGPGSFTGIRVGLALAKGMADGLGMKIIPIDNFELILHRLEKIDNNRKYCVLIPAKKPEFYYLILENKVTIESSCSKIDEIKSKIDKNVVIVGNFSDESEKNLGYFDFINVKGLKSELEAMLELASEKFTLKLLLDSNDIEPLYLKDFTFRKSI